MPRVQRGRPEKPTLPAGNLPEKSQRGYAPRVGRAQRALADELLELLGELDVERGAPRGGEGLDHNRTASS